MLSALYYPFSRCVDADALKQLLLVFDSITFLDPVEDAAWRARLFRDLERVEDQRFAAYRALERPLLDLIDEQVIVLRRPEDLDSFQSEETTASAISDLSDPLWCAIASAPGPFKLPHRKEAMDGRATWQAFPDKVPPAMRDELHKPSFSHHVIWSNRYDHSSSWTLSYEAGSAAALNLHLAAAAELSLAPVTDSAMHHRLLVRKLVRSVTTESEWVQQTSPLVEALANRTALQLIDQLVPRHALVQLSFEAILRFREETRALRALMVDELKVRLSATSGMQSLAEITSHQQSVSTSMAREIREYRAGLWAARDKLWPGLVKSLATAVSAGTAAAMALQYLVDGSYGVLAGSIGGASLGLLQAALEQRAETKKIERSVTSSVAYLSQVAAL